MEGCRVCKGELKQVLDLGEIYPSTFICGDEQLEKAPLRLGLCSKCRLAQLMDTADLDKMYRYYWYRSALNGSMVTALSDIVDSVQKYVTLEPGHIVVDIGTNDGSLLNFYPDYIYKVGIDPAYNLRIEAEKHCNAFINDYFSYEVLPRDCKPAKVITAIAMFYDLPDPLKFLQDVKNSLAAGGIFVVQIMDLLSMLKTNGFDNICAEHLEYYSLDNLLDLFDQVGLEIFDAEYNKVNGGSLRVYACHTGERGIQPHLVCMLIKEFLELRDDSLQEFAKRVQELKQKVNQFFESNKNKSICGLGASTKANTVLQYFGLDNSKIKAIGEIHPDKFGLKMVGTNIPIVPEKEILDANPDYIVLLIWQFADNILPKLQSYIDNGGKVLVMLPKPRLITQEGEIWV